VSWSRPREFWGNYDNIMSELEFFFEARREDDARILSRRSPVRDYLGLSDEQQKRARKRGALADRNLYGELRR
jgi:hypothetical protein